MGTKALLVITKEINASVVEKLTTTLLKESNNLKKHFPYYHTLYKKTMLEGLTIKQHPAATKAFNAF